MNDGINHRMLQNTFCSGTEHGLHYSTQSTSRRVSSSNLIWCSVDGHTYMLSQSQSQLSCLPRFRRWRAPARLAVPASCHHLKHICWTSKTRGYRRKNRVLTGPAVMQAAGRKRPERQPLNHSTTKTFECNKCYLLALHTAGRSVLRTTRGRVRVIRQGGYRGDRENSFYSHMWWGKKMKAAACKSTHEETYE